MAITINEYKDRAKALHDRLKGFIRSEPAPDGVDYSDVYDLLDKQAIGRMLEELEFAAFKRDRSRAEFAIHQLIDLL